jgi:hypothetical protein
LTKVILIKDGGFKTTTNILVHGEEIRTVTSYKFLGLSSPMTAISMTRSKE